MKKKSSSSSSDDSDVKMKDKKDGTVTQQQKKKDDDDSSSSEMHIVKPGTDTKMTDNFNEKGNNKRKREEDQTTNKRRKKNDGTADAKVKVRLGNLSFELDGKDEEIKKHFAECGEITGVEMIKKRDGKFAGVAIIEFADEEGANEAMKWNETDFFGRKLKLSFSSEEGGGKKK